MFPCPLCVFRYIFGLQLQTRMWTNLLVIVACPGHLYTSKLTCLMAAWVANKRSSIIGVNSLAPGGFENIFQNVFFKLISWIDTLGNSCETALRSMPQNPSDDKSTLVQVMAWCRQAASHYLSQCCPKSLSPYGVTRPQWVNIYLVLRKRLLYVNQADYDFWQHLMSYLPHRAVNTKIAFRNVLKQFVTREHT